MQHTKANIRIKFKKKCPQERQKVPYLKAIFNVQSKFDFLKHVVAAFYIPFGREKIGLFIVKTRSCYSTQPLITYFTFGST